MQRKLALAIHGGAGTILKSELSAELEMEYRQALEKALRTGFKLLESGDSAMNAVEATVVELENCPLFNAGKGAVFTHEGKNEMDACIMDGEKLRAGAVAFVQNIKNPVKLARLVMQNTPHILLAGKGANDFAREMKVEFEPDDYFFTEFRYQQLLKAREEGIIQLDHTPDEGEIIGEFPEKDENDSKTNAPTPKNLGTVGAVACDSHGNLAAATSTGGMTNKKYGRIGDTPLVGAGTYADNRTCAVSCTGHGEFFMLGVTAYDVAARMKYKNLSLADSARESIEYLTEIGGEGGLITVDANGNVALPFNSSGMYRGFVTSDKKLNVEIYKNS